MDGRNYGRVDPSELISPSGTTRLQADAVATLQTRLNILPSSKSSSPEHALVLLSFRYDEQKCTHRARAPGQGWGKGKIALSATAGFVRIRK